MPSFVYPSLLWGLLIVGIPVLIHLINMLRHRRVEWAAMEFLFVSQKKNRTWVVMKQLLLLLLRMLAIAAVVMMVAKPRPQNWLGKWFGSTTIHHIVLLDDSFSMSDRWADTSALAEGLAVVQQIGKEATRQVRPQQFTLLRFSRAAQLERGTRPDLWEEPVNSEFSDQLAETLEGIQVSQTAAGPSEALAAIGQLLGDTANERRIVYIVSDFRARQWSDPTDLKRQLSGLNEADAEIHLINCVDHTRKNLALCGLAPAEGIRAAGVQFFMEVSVKNFDTVAARNVSVFLEERDASDNSRADQSLRTAVTIAEISPGETVTERFRVHSPSSGRLMLTARLKPDAVEFDDARYAAVDLLADVPVLLIDGSPEARGAQFVGFALDPGGPVRTGIRPQIETPRYLSLKPLDEFHAITLLDVDWLDESAIAALEEYVRAGGGLAVFVGERCGDNPRFVNDYLYCNGQGLFPLPLLEAEPRILQVSRVDRTPDLQVENHPIFRILAGRRNSFVSTVVVQQYLAPVEGWVPEPDSSVRVIARLRNGDPLAVERRYGKGRVVAVLSTADPAWNNWARNPSFAPAMLDLQSYLAERPSTDVSRQVGTKLQLELDSREYQGEVRFVPPGQEHDRPGNPLDSSSDPASRGVYEAVLTEQGTLAVSLPPVESSGICETVLVRTDGTKETQSYAFNVDPEEGNLKTLSGDQLATGLKGVRYEYDQATAFQYAMADDAGDDISDWLLGLLVLLLIGEQILAFSASYHPTPGHSAATNKGGVR